MPSSGRFEGIRRAYLTGARASIRGPIGGGTFSFEMRSIVLAAGFVLLATVSFAQPGHRKAESFLAPVLAAEIEALRAARLGDLTGAEIASALERVSVAMQQDAYVSNAARASFMFPGLGQLKVGDTLGGVLFITGTVAVHAGTLLGAYALLPADLQFAQLDYLDTSKAAIEAAWKAHTPSEMLPAIGVAMAGALADGILRAVSSHHAGRLARERVESGSVEFEPRLMLHGNGMSLRVPFG
jgi:hypothetical protein